MRASHSLKLPTLALLATLLALGVGYRYADLTRHHAPRVPAAGPEMWPGTTEISGTLASYRQRVMRLSTPRGTFGIILALSTVVLPNCGHEPTFQPGEALAVRVPGHGDGTILAASVREARRCR